MDGEIRYCTTVDGIHIAYSTAGQGSPVLRVLGWLSNLEYSPAHDPIWGSWHDALVPYHRVVTYDGRGCGLSDRAVADLSLAAKVRDVEAVVEALELPRVALIGTSEGGTTAIAYAARHPERVSHLVLYDAFTYSEEAIKNPDGIHAMQTMMRQYWGQNVPAFRQFFAGLQYPDADTGFYDWYDGLQRASATGEEAAAFLAAAAGPFDVRDRLSNLTMPTLVIHRRGDVIVPFERGRELAVGIPGARFLPLEGRNHFVLPGEPAATVLFPELVRFLQDDTLTAAPGSTAEPPVTAPLHTPSPSHAVFLSYATEDRIVADRLCAVLEGAGLSCWMAPRDIPPGADYAAAIIAALERSQALVVLFSEHANRSPHVRRELDRAVSADLPVLPVRIEDVVPSPSLAYFLSTCQWMDALTEPLEPVLTQLAGRIRQVITPVE